MLSRPTLPLALKKCLNSLSLIMRNIGNWDRKCFVSPDCETRRGFQRSCAYLCTRITFRHEARVRISSPLRKFRRTTTLNDTILNPITEHVKTKKSHRPVCGPVNGRRAQRESPESMVGHSDDSEQYAVALRSLARIRKLWSWTNPVRCSRHPRSQHQSQWRRRRKRTPNLD